MINKTTRKKEDKNRMKVITEKINFLIFIIFFFLSANNNNNFK